jgi:NADH:ubiquinone oxidoreductase subunit 5 (subunit L)/multisubunit Na+/H+ antiporter MnhA subunit
MLVNRIGDLSLLIGISIIFYNILSLKYVVIFNIITYYLQSNFILFIIKFNIITIVCLFLFLGAMGKSAQLGLHM